MNSDGGFIRELWVREEPLKIVAVARGEGCTAYAASHVRANNTPYRERRMHREFNSRTGFGGTHKSLLNLFYMKRIPDPAFFSGPFSMPLGDLAYGSRLCDFSSHG